MTYKICYWDGQSQQERDCTPEEIAEIEARKTAPPPVPASVSPRQIRQALTATGLRVGVEAAVAAGDQDVKDWYEYATEFQRSNQHVIEMGVALDVSPAQLDSLWILAGSM